MLTLSHIYILWLFQPNWQRCGRSRLQNISVRVRNMRCQTVDVFLQVYERETQHLNFGHQVSPFVCEYNSVKGGRGGSWVVWGGGEGVCKCPYLSLSWRRVLGGYVWWGSSCGHVNRKVRVQCEGLNLWAVYQIANEAEQSWEGPREWGEGGRRKGREKEKRGKKVERGGGVMGVWICGRSTAKPEESPFNCYRLRRLNRSLPWFHWSFIPTTTSRKNTHHSIYYISWFKISRGHITQLRP